MRTERTSPLYESEYATSIPTTEASFNVGTIIGVRVELRYPCLLLANRTVAPPTRKLTKTTKSILSPSVFDFLPTILAPVG